MKKIKKVIFLSKKEKKTLFLQPERKPLGSLAQLVQSIALTRRGSLVRVQQFPQQVPNKKPQPKGWGFCLVVSPGFEPELPG